MNEQEGGRDCHPWDSTHRDQEKGNVKEGGGSNPFPRGDKGRQPEVVQSRKEVVGVFYPPQGTKSGQAGGRGRGARLRAEGRDWRLPGLRGHPGWRIWGRWGIIGDCEAGERRRPTRGTKREAAGLCRRRIESSRSRAQAEGGTQTESGTWGSEGKVR